MRVNYNITNPPHVFATEDTTSRRACHLPDGDGGLLCNRTNVREGVEYETFQPAEVADAYICRSCVCAHPTDEYGKQCTAITDKGVQCSYPAATCQYHHTTDRDTVRVPPLFDDDQPDTYPIHETPHLFSAPTSTAHRVHLPTKDGDIVCNQSLQTIREHHVSVAYTRPVCKQCLALHPSDEYAERCEATTDRHEQCKNAKSTCQHHADEEATVETPTVEELQRDMGTAADDGMDGLARLFGEDYPDPNRYTPDPILWREKEVLYQLYWGTAMSMPTIADIFDANDKQISEALRDCGIQTRWSGLERNADDPATAYADEMRETDSRQSEETAQTTVDWTAAAGD